MRSSSRGSSTALPPLATLAVLLLLAQPARGEEVRPAFFPLGVETCFGRIYDESHLKAHPGQRAASFFLWNELTEDPLREYDDETSAEKLEYDRDPENRLQLRLFMHLRDRLGLQTQSFDCLDGDKEDLFCGVDCDGGYFTGMLDGKSLVVTNEGFQLEGVCEGGMDYLEPGTADRVFRLDPLPSSACREVRDNGRPSLAEGGEPLRARLGAPDSVCYSRSYDAKHLAENTSQSVAAIWLKKSGEDFFIGARLNDGSRAEAKANCFANTYSWSCFNPGSGDVEYMGPNNSYAMPSPAAILARGGKDALQLTAHRGNLAKLLGLKLDTGDDVFMLNISDMAACGAK